MIVEIGGVGPREEEFQHFSHLTMRPNQVDPLTDSMNFLALKAISKRTNAVESTGTKYKLVQEQYTYILSKYLRHHG